MSKKTRRYRTPNLPTSAYAAPVAEQATSAAQVTRPGSVGPAIGNSNWQDDYHEVFGDLRRTGVIAAVLLVGMGLLAFFVR